MSQQKSEWSNMCGFIFGSKFEVGADHVWVIFRWRSPEKSALSLPNVPNPLKPARKNYLNTSELQKLSRRARFVKKSENVRSLICLRKKNFQGKIT